MNLQTSNLAGLNDDECRRILSVIERDFQLRQKEAQRLDHVKRVVREEHERVKYLAQSPDFNSERCIRCYKSFTIFFNPREKCGQCQFFVCHQCSTQDPITKEWNCRSCLSVKELSNMTANWFYQQSSRKHKRCGSAKVIRELHKREKELAEVDDDLGYATLPNSFTADTTGASTTYVIHDKTIRNELAQYSKRLALLVDNLLADLAQRRNSFDHDHFKEHRQLIQAEITRARTALSAPLRRMKTTSTKVWEIDLQNVLTQQTEDLLQINLQPFQKSVNAIPINSNDFDRKLAEIIVKKATNQEISSSLPHVIDAPLHAAPAVSKSLVRSYSSDAAFIQPSKMNLRKKLHHSRTEILDEEENSTSSNDQEKQAQSRSIPAHLEIIRFSNDARDDWKIEGNSPPSSSDGEEIISSWL